MVPSSGAVDLRKLERALKGFISNHRAEFDRLGKRQAQMLEVGALAACAEHYRRAGYEVVPANVVRGAFRVLLSTKDHPWNFSRFDVFDAEGELVCEIHANLKTRGAFGLDGGVYVVDVAVVRPNVVPRTQQTSWNGIDNDGLFTFIEVKSLVVYPMLVAQFIGIAHEVMPRFVLSGGRDPRGFKAAGHFYPTLACLGYLQGITRGVVDHLGGRRIRLNIVDVLAVRLGFALGGDDAAELPMDGTFVLAAARADTDDL